MVYNSMVQGYILKTLKGGISDAENLSAEEAPQKKGAWFQKKNVYCQWPQGACPQKSKGQKTAFLLMAERADGLEF